MRPQEYQHKQLEFTNINNPDWPPTPSINSPSPSPGHLPLASPALPRTPSALKAGATMMIIYGEVPPAENQFNGVGHESVCETNLKNENPLNMLLNIC